MAELLGESPGLGAGGVQVGFRSLGADAQRVPGVFQGSDTGVGGVNELAERMLVVGADPRGLFRCGGLGALGAGGGGVLGLAAPPSRRLARCLPRPGNRVQR